MGLATATPWVHNSIHLPVVTGRRGGGKPRGEPNDAIRRTWCDDQSRMLDDDISRIEEDKLGSGFYDKHAKMGVFIFILYVGNRTLRGRYIFLACCHRPFAKLRAPNATTTAEQQHYGFSHQPRERRSPYCPRPRSRPPLPQSGKAGRQAPAERNRQGDGRHHADHARALWQEHIRASYMPAPPLLFPRLSSPPLISLFSCARKTLTISFFSHFLWSNYEIGWRAWGFHAYVPLAGAGIHREVRRVQGEGDQRNSHRLRE